MRTRRHLVGSFAPFGHPSNKKNSQEHRTYGAIDFTGSVRRVSMPQESKLKQIVFKLSRKCAHAPFEIHGYRRWLKQPRVRRGSELLKKMLNQMQRHHVLANTAQDIPKILALWCASHHVKHTSDAITAESTASSLHSISNILKEKIVLDLASASKLNRQRDYIAH